MALRCHTLCSLGTLIRETIINTVYTVIIMIYNKFILVELFNKLCSLKLPT